MPASMQNVTPDTPLGATLVAGGATFRVWAPGATEVHVVLQDFEDFEPGDTSLPTRDAQGRWAGFVAPVVEGQCYMSTTSPLPSLPSARYLPTST
ncbi:hypothetical protein WKW80_22840 [Variovorax humicola]|uniref:Glycoside hydrolase family 13 N-terminal domain-containing protein n=1 Tax=Variovorax humicola TaxID=1769758 RepID=A0ABU8W4L6_9BURK